MVCDFVEIFHHCKRSGNDCSVALKCVDVAVDAHIDVFTAHINSKNKRIGDRVEYVSPEKQNGMTRLHGMRQTVKRK